MKRLLATPQSLSLLCGLLFFLDAPPFLLAQPSIAAVSAFHAYTNAVEARLAQQHRSPDTFLAPTSDPATAEARLHRGDLLIERVLERGAPSSADISAALLHHWRGTAFAPGAKAADFERLIRDFNAYPQHFAPQVLTAKVIKQSSDRITATMRVRQHHVITLVMDSTYDIAFGRTDRQHGYSISQSTRITEVDSPGTPAERTLADSEAHGFLWRLNTYWSYEERDGGLYLQIEAVTLTRSIPRGLGWVIKPYIESIPRESLEFTLRSACNALRKSPATPTTTLDTSTPTRREQWPSGH